MDECSVLTMRTNVIDLTRAVDEVKRLCCSNAGAYVCVSTVHMCLEAYKSPSFEKIVNDANLVIADGKPIAIAQRLLGHKRLETTVEFYAALDEELAIQKWVEYVAERRERKAA